MHPTSAISRRTAVRAGLFAPAGLALSAGSPASAAPVPRAAPARTLSRLTLSSAGRVRRGRRDFRAGGVNAFQLITNDYPQPRLMRTDEIDGLLDKTVALGARVLRAHTLAASVGGPHCLVTGVSGTGPQPTIHYDQEVWDRIDYAVWRANQVGVYLIAPLVDELGYYHGGKRHWVDFRHPGSVSLDSAVTAASSTQQRAAESMFYQDQQVVWDFQQFVTDWLTHLNPMTGVAFRDDPALSVVQVGNELWTAAQDAPGWVAATAAHIKRVAPTTLVMDSGADGLAVTDMAWDSPDIDILETHPYSVFGPADVRAMAAFAAARGKAFAVGEYPWSKAAAPRIEAVVRRSDTIFTSALWSLQNDGDLHHDGAAYGGDDVSLYVPGKDATQRAATRRLVRHHRRLARASARSRR